MAEEIKLFSEDQLENITTDTVSYTFGENQNDKVQIEIKNLSSASIWGQPWRWDEIVKEIYDL